MFFPDIQPVIVTGCPNNIEAFVSNMTSFQTWTEPTFYDPHGSDVVVSMNYPESRSEFPWGVFSVQYSAVKPSNGLSSECTFNVSVKRKTNSNCKFK